MTDPRTLLKTKIVTYLDALIDEDGGTISVRHYFSDGQEPLSKLFKTNAQDLLIVYRRGAGREAKHAASGIFAYTRNVEVGVACIDKRKDTAGNMRIKGQKLLNSAIEEIDEVVREQSHGASFVTSDNVRYENVDVGGKQLLYTAWLTVPVRMYAI
jgi:hypothetical protein